ncbi:MAG: hypothetical protein NE328_20565 [Lentisphaeraceae bacterium]|nr:hypothetical protein [Lentisphaeraceae bacterium]
MNKSFSLVSFVLIALVLTFYGLPIYKQKMRKYIMQQRIKNIPRIVELYYVDEKIIPINK